VIAPDPAATVLRASTYRRTRWKNGGGATMEIAVSPIGSSLDNFDWRISTATVASDGPFSIFTGIDRTLCILDGAGILLVVAGEPARRLDDKSPPWSFAGDVVAHAQLIEGAVTDFNVMTRRSRWTHRVDRIRLHSGDRREVPADARAVFCQAGVVSTDVAGQLDRLEARDTMLRHMSDRSAWSLLAEVAATICVVTIAERAATESS
jgi:environmental stress-induced protein Ves